MIGNVEASFSHCLSECDQDSIFQRVMSMVQHLSDLLLLPWADRSACPHDLAPPATGRAAPKSGSRQRRTPGASLSDVAKLRHHARGQVRHVMAVEHPSTGILRVKGDRDPPHRRDVNGIPNGPRVAL